MAQCWCYNCGGVIVSRQTFANHGHKDKPDEPEPDDPIRLVSYDSDIDDDMPPLTSGSDDDDDYESDSESDNSAWETDSDSDDDQLRGEDDEAPCANDNKSTGRGQLNRHDVTMLILDWIACRKVTDTAAAGVWEIVQLLMPEGANVPSWGQIKRALRAAENDNVIRVDVCVNDCVAFYDRCVHTKHTHPRAHPRMHPRFVVTRISPLPASANTHTHACTPTHSEHLPEEYKHAHRTSCPVCGEDRKILDPTDGAIRSRKVCITLK
jgi:hypothetical protein